MSNWTRKLRATGKGAAVGLIVAVALGGLTACDSLLDVDLPANLTDEALEDPAGADTQVNSIVALFECGYSAYAWDIRGDEEVVEVMAGVASGTQSYFEEPDDGEGCDDEAEDNGWWREMSASRRIGSDLYDRLQNEWTVEQVPQKERLSAETALYQAATLDFFGATFCDMAIDGGELMTPDETLARADTWVENALGHISNTGDFEVRNGVTSSARTMAMGLRARIRWGMGDMSGALSAAQAVPQGFMAFVTRESGLERRNKVFSSGTQIGFTGILGVNDWWSPGDRSIPVSNAVWGDTWPNPIPFTGYLFLGIMPATGRAVMDNGLPVRWAEEERAIGEDPTPLGNGAVEDTRVQHFKKSIQGPEPREVPDKYQSAEDDIPLVNWREMWLIRADIQNRMNDDQQAAIDLINDLRNAAGLPEIQGAYEDQLTDGTNDRQEVRFAITEEWRRALWIEGRYYPYKVQNTDLLWFPRNQGEFPTVGFGLNGSVRRLLPEDEYTRNENLSLADRGTGCSADERPVF